ncbi:DNA primase [Dirofilaria immitis]|nr:DNA primase [Dirofilaria immitis]
MDSNSARRRVAIRIAEFVLPILEPGYTDPYNICNELELEYKEENTNSANNESIVRVSMHGQDSSISTEPNFSSSMLRNKNSNLKIEPTQIPSDQNQEKSGSNKGIKDDVTPLNSEPTEEDTEIGAIKEKQEIGIEKESSKENKKNFNIKTTRKSLMRNQLNMRMLENGVVTAGTKMGMKELETNQSQVSADSIPSYSSKSATGDEEMEKSNDEFSDSEETKSEK